MACWSKIIDPDARFVCLTRVALFVRHKAHVVAPLSNPEKGPASLNQTVGGGEESQGAGNFRRHKG